MSEVVAKKSQPKKKLGKNIKLKVYANLPKLSISKKTNTSAKDAKKLKYLNSLPKHSYKRWLFCLNPANFKVCWFNKKGGLMLLRFLGICLIIVTLLIGGMFAYFRKDLDSIRPSELAKNVKTSVNTYLDRNGELLWEDKGSGNYKLVIKDSEISDLVKKATVAIEDKNFYKHRGVSITGLIRAFLNNLFGGKVQGGSTLTQQLIKQVFFSQEAGKRNLSGIPRKIKEVILAVEVERMYNKDQIIALYLNESPYGGPRNGVESGAQTYFGKHTKDLTLPEAALLAAIPQNPPLYNPYNVTGNEYLINRQHAVLDNMVSLKFVSKEEAKTAKEYPILDHLIPVAEQYTDIKAPHFVQMARSAAEAELGTKLVGKGGLTITTTLDLRVQNKVEEALNDMFNSNTPVISGFSNGAVTVEDVKTGQIIALAGSRDFKYPGFGQDNATTASIQPGSSIKPFVYTELFEKKPADQLNFGSGTILKDENIDSLYGTRVYNADRTFRGDITIRSGLATSRNIPAIKAMYISGIQNTLKTIREMGVKSYCTVGQEVNAGLSSAIGSCGAKQIDMVNGYATLARGGVYKPQSLILEAKDSNNKFLKKWSDPVGKQVVSNQATYIVSDILTDRAARAPLSGWNTPGMNIPDVKTATKTGTSDIGGYAKDIWMFSYSPAIAMGVWLGNSDATILKQGTSSIPGPIIEKVMSYVHKDIYAPAGLWGANDWFSVPNGIQKVGNEFFPAWWDKKQKQTEEKMIFDKLSRRKATDLTPELAKIEIDVVKTIDPITKKEIYIAPDGYDANKEDNKHLAGDTKPSIEISAKEPSLLTPSKVEITINAISGQPYSLSEIQLYINGNLEKTLAPGETTYTYFATRDEEKKTIKIHAIALDTGYYASQSRTVEVEIPAKISLPVPIWTP